MLLVHVCSLHSRIPKLLVEGEEEEEEEEMGLASCYIATMFAIFVAISAFILTSYGSQVNSIRQKYRQSMDHFRNIFFYQELESEGVVVYSG